MKHHFGDMLDREGDYWTVLPNRERYAYSIDNVPSGSKDITIATISKGDERWGNLFSCPNLEELTLHEPSKQQLISLSKLERLKRLRITHARTKDIEFIAPLVNVEELILEYVSGFSDLSPLRCLTKLRSLHLENLRRVSDFTGLSGIESLRYLRIDGTLDWKQPIADFQFLFGLPKLEVLSFGRVVNTSTFPAILPALSLKNLKHIKMAMNMFSAEEYALLSVGLNGVEGADIGPFRKRAYSTVALSGDDLRSQLPAEVLKRNHPEVRTIYTGERVIDNPDDTWYEFTGKGAGRVKLGSASCEARCAEYSVKFEEMKSKAKQIIDENHGLTKL